MSESPVQVSINFKQFEALFWCLGTISNDPDRVPVEESDPLYVLLAEGYSREEIMTTALQLTDRISEDFITEPLSELDKSMLRVCVENTSWISAYIEYGALGGFNESGCRKVLRELAYNLEPLGVEINHLPKD